MKKMWMWIMLLVGMSASGAQFQSVHQVQGGFKKTVTEALQNNRAIFGFGMADVRLSKKVGYVNGTVCDNNGWALYKAFVPKGTKSIRFSIGTRPNRMFRLLTKFRASSNAFETVGAPWFDNKEPTNTNLDELSQYIRNEQSFEWLGKLDTRWKVTESNGVFILSGFEQESGWLYMGIAIDDASPEGKSAFGDGETKMTLSMLYTVDIDTAKKNLDTINFKADGDPYDDAGSILHKGYSCLRGPYEEYITLSAPIDPEKACEEKANDGWEWDGERCVSRDELSCMQKNNYTWSGGKCLSNEQLSCSGAGKQWFSDTALEGEGECLFTSEPTMLAMQENQNGTIELKPYYANEEGWRSELIVQNNANINATSSVVHKITITDKLSNSITKDLPEFTMDHDRWEGNLTWKNEALYLNDIKLDKIGKSGTIVLTVGDLSDKSLQRSLSTSDITVDAFYWLEKSATNSGGTSTDNNDKCGTGEKWNGQYCEETGTSTSSGNSGSSGGSTTNTSGGSGTTSGSSGGTSTDNSDKCGTGEKWNGQYCEETGTSTSSGNSGSSGGTTTNTSGGSGTISGSSSGTSTEGSDKCGTGEKWNGQYCEETGASTEDDTSSEGSSSAPSASEEVATSDIDPKYIPLLDALVNGGSYQIDGMIFYHEFDDGDMRYHWVYYDKNNNTFYRMMKAKPSDQNIFGWAKTEEVTVVEKNLQYAILALPKWSDSVDRKYDYMIINKETGESWKLEGVNENGSFVYSDQLGFKLTIDQNGVISFEK
jgi:hypothetical protein